MHWKNRSTPQHVEGIAVIDMEKNATHNNRNKLYQDEEGDAINKFSKAHGFDNLVQIRGLLSVSLIVPPWDGEKYREVVKAFEAFLKRTLTMPKDSSVSQITTESHSFKLSERLGYCENSRSADFNTEESDQATSTP